MEENIYHWDFVFDGLFPKKRPSGRETIENIWKGEGHLENKQ